MTEISAEEVRKIVRQVLAELGHGVRAATEPKQEAPPRRPDGPRTLIVFHAGVRKLDLALDQIAAIEQSSGRAAVFTGPSARAWVCGADVREQAGTRCILDNVRPDALDKVLARADILVLPTLCYQVAAKATRLIGDDTESRIVLTALLHGKKVLAVRDGFLFCEYLANERLRAEIDGTLRKLEEFGVVLCKTEELHAAFLRITAGDATGSESESLQTQAEKPRLLTGKMVMTAVDNKEEVVRVAKGAIVTPLARDLVREYGLRIIEDA